MSIAGNVRTVKTYSLHRDDSQVLAALLTTALVDHTPLVVIATDENTGARIRREGYVLRTTADRVTLDIGRGESFVCCRWEVDQAALTAEMWEAA